MSFIKIGISCFLLSLAGTGLVFASSDSQIVMKKGAIAVTQEDVERYIVSKIPEDRRHQTINKPDSLKKIIENIYVLRAIAAQSNTGVDIDLDQLAWEADMERTRIESSMVINKLIEDAYAKQDWDKAAREVYIAEPERFMTGEQVAASHILISVEKRSDAEALALAESVKKKINSGGTFDELVSEYSEDPSASSNKGNLGYFGKGKMVPAFEKAVFSMSAPGSVSDIVKTQFGYHIIRLDDIRPAGKKSFEQVKPEIIRGLRARIASQIQQNVTTEARSIDANEVYYNQDVLDAVFQKYEIKLK